MWLIDKLIKPKKKPIKTVVIDTKKSQTKSWILGETKEIELSDIDICIEDDD